MSKYRIRKVGGRQKVHHGISLGSLNLWQCNKELRKDHVTKVEHMCR